MQNIWAFLLQTTAASVTAAVLLCLKALFRRQFSPRWQYGVWGVLLVSLLLPASSGGLVFPTLGLRLETLKTSVESVLHPAYSAPYDVTQVTFPFPLFPSQGPHSVTDWLFILYLTGVALSLLFNAAAYIRLRLSLRRAVPSGQLQLEQIERVCTLYKLRPCARTVVSPHTQTAFICGVIRPVLVLPAGTTVDDKVVLHELLHRRYGDVAAGMALCLFRCLHWCNPFLRYVLRRVQADCEALCDQRVLERLTGEDLRDYGHILLSMADSRRLRVPGTSSIANGGKNIRARIESIARHRLYPREMQLVSACIVLVILFGCSGWLQTPVQAWSGYNAVHSVQDSMAFARLYRARSPQDAFWLYAAALLDGDGCILARITPLSQHEELAKQLQETDGMLPLDVQPSGLCALYNLREAGQTATALLVYESGHCFSLRAVQQTDGWTVECLEQWQQKLDAFGFFSTNDLPPFETYSASNDLIEVELTAQFVLLAEPSAESASPAQLDGLYLPDPTLYEAGLSSLYYRAGSGLHVRWLGDEPAQLSGALVPFYGQPPASPLDDPGLSGESVSSSNNGTSAFSAVFEPGELRDLGGGGNSAPADENWHPPTLPDGYLLSVYCDGALLDSLVLTPGGAS